MVHMMQAMSRDPQQYPFGVQVRTPECHRARPSSIIPFMQMKKADGNHCDENLIFQELWCALSTLSKHLQQKCKVKLAFVRPVLLPKTACVCLRYRTNFIAARVKRNLKDRLTGNEISTIFQDQVYLF